MLKLQFKDNPSRSYWLVGEQLSLGSDSRCNVPLAGLGINAIHAHIAMSDELITLTPQQDCVCYVNSRQLTEPQTLQEGDEIRIGGERLLIIDPKKQSAKLTAPAKQQPAPQKTKVWTLVAEHPKLKDRPFLITDKSILGRSKEVNLFIPFKHLSREHAELTVVGDTLQLKDLGSSNGCFVNGERANEYSLSGGETVSFAFLDFVVHSPVATKPASDMDVTMVRSAITQADIERVQRESKTPSQTLDLSEIDQRQQQLQEQAAQPKYWLWAGVVVIIAAGLAYSIWQYGL
ncbi:FHA domain-containing protein [Dasania sp. GY-MA-18]|uniref:FHA domain-containing protein n=1 Tax=Dasania phycosphaerae TaxID=2950436 RepID=A0A9J6RLE5_9GAMM|nr:MULTISPECIES: FHA domain-containing protein [Dasania]MCR8922578.1 FHA domain-containing protein [Dasania sp. GY-MA-18]MCZ0865007.1 FHA domain-containing protein [Dasania phycosphaerae]MCZ0868734.1 FHA domain-containing protein [Dasania phycosphaerae]